MRLGFSKRKMVPALFLSGSRVAFPLWAYSYLRRFEGSGFSLTPYAENVLSELRCGYYKPYFSLEGKTVLDLGACCGESAWYFLKVLGAKKVVCVECDPQNIELLKRNRVMSGLDFEVIPERFNVNHLKLQFDFVKCDIEGGEVDLVHFIECEGMVKPCVVEVHNEDLRKRFEAVGFSVAHTFVGLDHVCFVMNNFGGLM